MANDRLFEPIKSYFNLRYVQKCLHISSIIKASQGSQASQASKAFKSNQPSQATISSQDSQAYQILWNLENLEKLGGIARWIALQANKYLWILFPDICRWSWQHTAAGSTPLLDGFKLQCYSWKGLTTLPENLFFGSTSAM